MGKYRQALDLSTADENDVVAPEPPVASLSLVPPPPPVIDEFVSVTIKVPKSLRQHWQVEAKKRDVTVSKLVVDFLSQTLGTP